MRMYWLLLPAFLMAPAAAFAHATPVAYEPEASASVQAAPDTVTIRFSERVEEGTSSIRVLGPDGGRIDAGAAVREAADARVYRTAIRDAGSGTYTVVWQVISADDGHFTKGAYSFAVGQAAAADESPRFEIVHSSALREALAVGMEMVGHALLLGMLAVLWLLSRNRVPLPLPATMRSALFAAAGSTLAIAGAALYIGLKAYDLSGVQEVSVAHALRQFLTTVAGSAALYRGVLAAVFLAVFLIFRRSAHRVLPSAVLLILVLGMMLLRARVSHAAASEWMPALAVAVNFLHLAAKSLWAGGLAALVFLAIPSLGVSDIARYARTSVVVSRYLSLVFAAVSVTGVFVIWLHLKDPSNAWNSLWGSRFLYLSAFATTLVALRLYHHLFLNPRLARGMTDGPVRISGLTLQLEMLLGIVMLMWSGSLVITTPPLAHAPAVLETADSQGLRLTLGEYPFDPSLLLFEASGSARERMSIGGVTLTLTQDAAGIGPIVAPLEKRYDGGYVLPLSAFSVPGTWTVDATVQRADAYDAVARFRLDPRARLQEALATAGKRTLDSFAMLAITAGAAASLFAVFLWRFAVSLERILPASGSGPLPPLTFGRLRYASLVAAFLVFIAVGFHVQMLNGSFREACTQEGFYWHENVPMREGRVVSNTARLGCMMGFGKGMFHLADEREFLYFGRPAVAVAALKTASSVVTAGTHEAMTFSIRDAKGEPVTDLVAAHDRYLHVVIVSEDFTVFQHVHAEGDVTEMLRTGDFPLSFTFPKAGRYLIALDYTVRNHEFSQEFYLDVAGTRPMDEPEIPRTRLWNVGGLTVTFRAPESIRAGSAVRLSYEFTRGGMPVTDLQPYLAAPMHVAVMRDDLRNFVHAHGQLPRSQWDRLTNLNPPSHVHVSLPERFGPTVETTVLFPQPGRYVLFGEFRHSGKTMTVPFAVQVR